MKVSGSPQLEPILRATFLIVLWVCATPAARAQAQGPQDVVGFRPRLVEASGVLESAGC